MHSATLCCYKLYKVASEIAERLVSFTSLLSMSHVEQGYEGNIIYNIVCFFTESKLYMQNVAIYVVYIFKILDDKQ